MTEPEKRYNIRVIERALGLLSLLANGRPIGLPELADGLEISESSTYRLLATLVSHNYVTHDKQIGGYRLGLACLELARAYQAGSEVRRIALTELEAFRDATSETVHLGVLDDMEVVYLEKIPGLHAIGIMSSSVGGRAPSYCTGLGKVLLAYLEPDRVQAFFSSNSFHSYTPITMTSVAELLPHLEQIRRQGFALDEGEHEAEVRCVAAPVFDAFGEVVAAVSVSGPAARLGALQEQEQLIRQTVDSAQAISAKLGYQPARQTDIRH